MDVLRPTLIQQKTTWKCKMTHSHRPPSFPVPHWPTISVASCAAFCSNRSFICLMLNFSVSASTSFLSRTEKTQHVSSYWCVLPLSSFIKRKCHYLHPLSSSVHRSVENRKKKLSVTQIYVQKLHFMVNILKDLLASDVLELCLIPSLALQRTISPPGNKKNIQSCIYRNIHTTLDTHSSKIPWEKHAGPEPPAATL